MLLVFLLITWSQLMLYGRCVDASFNSFSLSMTNRKMGTFNILCEGILNDFICYSCIVDNRISNH